MKARRFRFKGRRYVVRWNPPYRWTLYQRMHIAATLADAVAFANRKRPCR